MTSYQRWKDIRAAHVERAGGEEAVEIGKQELLAMCLDPATDEQQEPLSRSC
ncbi:MAG TPA: hypothetical protein VG247_04470 [Pseudonocardiaceae bacterium]|jgi:hypothetical protein|nr:hypothetical protein [Pseudonocardiaceae bacterium]